MTKPQSAAPSSIPNFRDFGGYRTDKGNLRCGLLYRSGHHAHATDEDLALLARMGISVIVDLRQARERQHMPSRRWPDCAATIIDCDLGEFPTEADDPYIQMVRRDLSEASLVAYLLQFYREVPFTERYCTLFAAWFRALGSAEGPVLMHCAGGKDRTGILVALTHKLLGVHHDDILADFLASNDHARPSKNLDSYRNFIAGHAGSSPTDDYMRRSMSVDASYMEAMFDALADQHGSGERYLTTVLGVDAALRARIEKRVLE